MPLVTAATDISVSDEETDRTRTYSHERPEYPHPPTRRGRRRKEDATEPIDRTTFCLRMTGATKRYVEAQAKLRGISMTDIIHEAIAEHSLIRMK